MNFLTALFSPDMQPTEPLELESASAVTNRAQMLAAIMAEDGDVVAVKAWRHHVKDPVTGLVRDRLEFAYCLSMTSMQLMRMRQSYPTQCTYLPKALWRMAVCRRPSSTAVLPLSSPDKVVAFPLWQRNAPNPQHV